MKKNLGKIIIGVSIIIIVILLYLLFNDADDNINDNGEKKVEKFNIPSGEVYMMVNSEYTLPIEYVPEDSKAKKIDYLLSRNDVIVVHNGIIKALKEGMVNLTIQIDDKLRKVINVNVVKQKINNGIYEKLNNVLLNEEISLKIGEEKKIDYSLLPYDGYLYDISYISSDDKIVSIANGKLKGLTSGEAKIKAVYNTSIEKEIKVKVGSEPKKIRLASNYLWLKEGNRVSLNASVEPSDAYNKEIIYQSNNPNIIEVDNNGLVYAKGTGQGIITLETKNGKIKEKIEVEVNPTKGLVNGNGGIWGFNNKTLYQPVRASTFFFEGLVRNGKGHLSNNLYTYNNNGVTYTYDLTTSLLKANDVSTLMRFYYPLNTDLSELNTFTFLGGIGESNFDGYFTTIDNNTNIIKSRGIIILITVKRKDEAYSIDGVIQATEFVKALINQRKDAHNNIGGYSKGGPDAGKIANKGNYQKLMIFNSQLDNIYGMDHLKQKEVYVYSTVADDMREQTKATLNYLMDAGYKNITVISNNSEIYNWYSNRVLVINPGNAMGSGHNNTNITNSNYFSFGCE